MFKHKGVALLVAAAILSLSGCNKNESTAEPLDSRARNIVSKMTLEEKIAQKLMMAFRYWCDGEISESCTKPTTEINDTIRDIIANDQIGGIIMFANNLVDVEQLTRLTWDMQQAVANDKPVGLFMAIDQEGGNVVRLPRDQATSFPGNMALAAASATQTTNFAYEQGKILAAEVSAVGFNINFAPVVDVQSNPLNPVINVRSFGDDPAQVALLGGQLAKGMASQNVIATFKHFPGHGDTQTDSHFGLPIVNRTLSEAFDIDLSPYQQAITQGFAPDMIMSAHIQYPALDNTHVIASKTGEEMLTPATLSRKMMHDLLRQRLNYEGIIITDALDMKGISSFFNEDDAVIKTFKAGVDIALMPTEIRTTTQRYKLHDIINSVANAVKNGELSEREITQSAERIILAKLKKEIVNQKESIADLEVKLAQAKATLGNSNHKMMENTIAAHSITLIKNEQVSGAPLLPISAVTMGKVAIFTPWDEQYQGFKRLLAEEGIESTGANLANTSLAQMKEAIDTSDTLIIATLSTGITPVEKDGVVPSYLAKQSSASLLNSSLIFNVSEDSATSFAAAPLLSNLEEAQVTYVALSYARANGKQTIVIAMRAPYDVINYADLTDVVLASYSYYGYNIDKNSWNSVTIPAITNVMLGKTTPKGRLPVNVYNTDSNGNLTTLRYARGHGLGF